MVSLYLFCVLGLTSYLVGSIPFGLLLTKLSGYGDIRNVGSGNIGATNVLRTGNKFLALATLLLDGSKGALSIYLFYFLLPFLTNKPLPLLDNNSHTYLYALILGMFAIVGHCFPIWLKFKGGKGVATSLGTLLAAIPYVGIFSCVTWLLIAYFFRYSSLAALTALAVTPFVSFYFYGRESAIVCLFIASIVWYRHKDNINRLALGSESKIGKKNSSPS